MTKYIDRDQFIDWLKTEIKFKDLSDGLGVCLVIMKEDFERAIKHMPDSIIKDVAPVKHGRWEWFEEWLPSTPDHPAECQDCGWRCSECKTVLEDIVGGYWDDIDREPMINYCPNCGAIMIYSSAKRSD